MEEVKRLAPNNNTLRKLYTLSGNQCAFPGCKNILLTEDGNFIGQICHIEAASREGQRFNEKMTNEQRREYDNLILLCYEHHIETNKVNEYTVEKMKKMKWNHEKKCISFIDKVVHNMQNSFQDITQMNKAKEVESLKNLFTVINNEDDRSEDEILEDITVFNRQIKKLTKMSPDAVNMFKIALKRASTDSSQLEFHAHEGVFFCPYELERSINMFNDFKFRSIIEEIRRNKFIDFDEDESKFFILFPNSEINYWYYIKEYEKVKNLDYDYIFNSFDFTCLD